jgi:uncharacterized protein (TIGR00661 family)
MIYVTLGTQKQSFKRLIEYLEKIDYKGKIYVQNGCVKYSTRNLIFVGLISDEEMNSYIKKSDIVISHGGGGSIFKALSFGKKVICVPRLKKYKEHINDHQLEIIDYLSKNNYIIKCNTFEELNNAIKNIKKINLKKYKDNYDKFISNIDGEIEDCLS